MSAVANNDKSYSKSAGSTLPQKAYFENKSKARILIENIQSGKELYRFYTNDTCAETAYDAIKAGWRDVPNGNGKVAASTMTSIILAFKFIKPFNPYQLHLNFKKQGINNITYRLQMIGNN